MLIHSIISDELKEAWDNKKSIYKNMQEMGLCADPNRTIPIVQVTTTSSLIATLCL